MLGGKEEERERESEREGERERRRYMGTGKILCTVLFYQCSEWKGFSLLLYNNMFISKHCIFVYKIFMSNQIRYDFY